MSDDSEFMRGFDDGYKSICGDGAAHPGYPSYAIPAGKTAYEVGFEKGKAKAEENCGYKRK